MHISKDAVVQMHFNYQDESGEVLDKTPDDQPTLYLHGHNNMLEGIESALDGKQAGDKVSVTLAPVDAFGERKEDAELRVSVKHLQGAKKWKPGMTAVVQTEKGVAEVTVLKVGLKMATIDTNHPHAGKTLTFNLDIVSVRQATQEELEHGHAQGAGGHQH